MSDVPETLTLSAADGMTLHGTWHACPEARGSVVVAAAMAVPERLYTPLAHYLASNGYACLTFDYRGIGRSVQTPQDAELGFYAWGEQDIGAAVREARRRVPDRPCVLLGHSAGAQLAGMSDARDAIDALVLVATGSAHWRHWPVPARYALAAVWYLVLPLVGRLTDHIPGRLLGSSQGVPSPIAREWARCARERRYIRGRHRRASDAGYEDFGPHSLVWSISDDRYAPEAATRALLRLYPRLSPQWRRITPADAGRARFGHFGWFRDYAQPYWRATVDWLDETLTTSR